jgi:uncharacterized protein (TIGR00297 family)
VWFWLSAEPSLAVLVIEHRPEVVALAHVPPVHVGKVQFRVDGLPDHEIGEAFGSRLDQKVGFVRKDQTTLHVGLVDVCGVESAGVDLLCERADGGGELSLAAEADVYLNRGGDGFGVVRSPDCHRSGRVDRPEFAFERRHHRFIENTHRDGDAVGTVLERPAENTFETVVGSLFQQVALGEDKGDVGGRGAVVEAVSEREIPVVQSHTDRRRCRLKSTTGPTAKGAANHGVGSGRVGSVKWPSEVAMDVTSTLRRAGGFAAVGTLALAAPELGRAVAAPFAVVALLAAFVIDEGRLFDLFARPQDRRDGRLNGLAGFALAATGLAVLSTAPRASMPTAVFVAAVLVVGYGNLGARAVEQMDTDPFRVVAGFSLAAFAAAVAGQLVVGWTLGSLRPVPTVAFLAAAGALVAALIRTMLFERDDPIVMLSTGLLLWLFEGIGVGPGFEEVGVALGVTVALGYVSYRTGTASVPGMVTGVLLGLLTIVFGGFGWFAVLIAFFGVGGLSAKYRYDEKRSRGVAEDNEGARGSGNVLGNAAVALMAVIGFAASAGVPVDGTFFRFAFTGSLAAAMSDTLSSEIGVLFDHPRLITTLEHVDPGTDGGITWQGYLVGVIGASIIAAVAVTLFVFDRPALAAATVVCGGVAGMTVDSVLGATLEGGRVGNQTVNFLGTLTGAIVSVALAAVLL